MERTGKFQRRKKGDLQRESLRVVLYFLPRDRSENELASKFPFSAKEGKVEAGEAGEKGAEQVSRSNSRGIWPAEEQEGDRGLGAMRKGAITRKSGARGEKCP